MSPIPNCPPGWLALMSAAVTAGVLGFAVGWRSRDWKVYFTQVFDHSQTRGEGE